MNKKQFSAAAYKAGFEPRYSGRDKTMYLQSMGKEGDLFCFDSLLHEAGHTTFNIKYQKS